MVLLLFIVFIISTKFSVVAPGTGNWTLKGREYGEG
jgi:hypothetical protein